MFLGQHPLKCDVFEDHTNRGSCEDLDYTTSPWWSDIQCEELGEFCPVKVIVLQFLFLLFLSPTISILNSKYSLFSESLFSDGLKVLVTVLLYYTVYTTFNVKHAL